MRRPKVYIAGPYRHPSESRVFDNIARAREAAKLIIVAGGNPFCPHLQTAFMGGLVPDEVFLANDLAWLIHADAVFALAGWRDSAGATDEVRAAEGIGLAVIEDELSLRRWIAAQANGGVQ